MGLRRISRLSGMVMGVVAALAVSVSVCVAAPAPGPKPAADKSLTVKEYVDAGVPAIDKPWTVNDYLNAATAAGEISKSDVTKLPRL